MWERDSGALPPPGEEEGSGWAGGEPSGADTAAGPNHLLHLVHLLGEEITTCEAQLKDELDQRKRYKVRDTKVHYCFTFHCICIFTSAEFLSHPSSSILYSSFFSRWMTAAGHTITISSSSLSWQCWRSKEKFLTW